MADFLLIFQLLYEIFDRLDFKSIKELREVCKTFNGIFYQRFDKTVVWKFKNRIIKENCPPLSYLENGTFQPKSVYLGVICGKPEHIEKFLQELGKTVRVLGLVYQMPFDLKDFVKLEEIRLSFLDHLIRFKNIPKTLKILELDCVWTMIKLETQELLKNLPKLELIKAEKIAVNPFVNSARFVNFIALEEEIQIIFQFLHSSWFPVILKSQINLMTIKSLGRNQIESLQCPVFQAGARFMPTKLLELYCSFYKVKKLF